MNLSKREKAMLLFLGALIIFVGYYKFVFTPQRNKISKLSAEKTQMKSKLDNMKIQISSMDKKQSDIKILNSKIGNKTMLLYPSIEQEKIIIEIDKLLNDNKIDGNLSFSEINLEAVEVKSKEEVKKAVTSPLTAIVNEYNNLTSKEKTQAVNGAPSKAKETTAVNAEQIKINLSFKGTYENFTKLLNSFENYSRKIAVTNIAISQNTESEISGTASLEVFAVPKITEEDAEYMKWGYENSYGKLNPFAGGSAGVFNSTIEEASKPKAESFDFALSSRGINSDLPTFMLGKAKDEGKKTYVYGDTASTEEVEIVFTKKDNNYYYKYKTSKGSYPLNYEGEGASFIPLSSEIIIKAFSSKRNNGEDKASVNIKIINKTDKNITVFVEGDDKDKPRISITGDAGNVDVKRN